MNDEIKNEGGREERAKMATNAKSAMPGKFRLRRRHVIGGLLGAPLITLVPPPAIAQVCTFSGLQSATHQSHSPETCSQGYSPGYWKENTDAWSGTPYLPGTCSTSKDQGNTPYVGGTEFYTAFGSDPAEGPSDLSLMNAMRLFNGSAQFHFVAALLNAYTVPGYPYTPHQIRSFWNDPTLAGPSVTRADLAIFFTTYLEQ